MKYMLLPRQDILAVLLIVASLGMISGHSYADDPRKSPSIIVSGSGTVSAKPDAVRIRVGVVTHNPSANRAVEANTEVMMKLISGLQKMGVAKKDLQTSSLTLTPQYRRQSSGSRGTSPEIAGYTATNLLQVKVGKLDMVGSLLDQAVRQGANRIDGITFYVENPEPHLDEARLAAVADARHKASLYAKAAGVKLGRLLELSDTPAVVPVQVRSYAVAGEAMAVEPGELEFRADISAMYAID